MSAPLRLDFSPKGLFPGNPMAEQDSKCQAISALMVEIATDKVPPVYNAQGHAQECAQRFYEFTMEGNPLPPDVALFYQTEFLKLGVNLTTAQNFIPLLRHRNTVD